MFWTLWSLSMFDCNSNNKQVTVTKATVILYTRDTIPEIFSTKMRTLRLYSLSEIYIYDTYKSLRAKVESKTTPELRALSAHSTNESPMQFQKL